MSQLCVRLLHLTSLHGAIWRDGACCLMDDIDGSTKHCLQVRLEVDAGKAESNVLLQVTTLDRSGKVMHILVSATESLLRGWFPATAYTRHIRMESGAEASVDDLLSMLMDIRSKENFHRLSGTIREYESVAPDLLMRRTKRIRQEELAIEKQIGEGGFGAAFVANYEDDKVVVKEIRGLMQDSPKETFGTFQNECYMMTLLKHPKIIRLIGICLHPVPMLVMEYASLGDLRHFLDKCSDGQTYNIPWLARLKIVFDIAHGMDYRFFSFCFFFVFFCFFSF